MSRPAQVFTAEQIKERLRMQGITVTQWASDRGYKRREVYRVLNGQSKAHYGTAHEIAVALGMKPRSDHERELITPSKGRNRQAGAAA